MPVFVGAGTSSFMKGDGGVGVSTMTTTERNALSSVKEGQFIFNSSLGLAQYYDGVDWKSIDSPPLVTSISIDGRSAASTGVLDRTTPTTQTIIIAGSLFDTTGAVVTFKGTAGSEGTVNTQSINRNNASQLTVTVTAADFLEADDPYDVVVTNGSGLAGKLASAIDVNIKPVFATAADTNIGNVENGQSNFSSLTSVAATDADGDTVTHTIISGSLPNGMSLAANGTFTGTCSGLPTSATESTFTVQAATTHYTISRQFKISAKDSFHVTATGGTVTTVGDYKVHTFLSDGTFTVSNSGHPSGSTTVEYLVVAGGGAGGRGQNAGSAAGGAGGLRTNFPSPATGGFAVNTTAYPVTVGDGGAGVVNAGQQGNNGSPSVFSSITSAGGGGGGGYQQNGLSGGSGGGGGSEPGGANQGNGNTPPVSPSQGNPGGSGGPGGPEYSGGGGGGHAQAGENGRGPGPGTYGGAGSQINIDGNNYYWAGGGGGPSWSGPSPGGNGGIGGGGGGHTPVPTTGSGSGGGSAINPGQPGGPGDGGPGGTNLGDGGANTGGGGGGGTNGAAGATGQGGKGIVILRYKYQ